MENGKSLALRTSLIFAAVSIAWIYSTDLLILFISPTKEHMAAWSVYKGLFYIAVVATLLYFIVHALMRNQCNQCRVFLDTVSDAIFLFDPETVGITDVNDRACGMFGYSRHEFLAGCGTTGKSGGIPFTDDTSRTWLKGVADGDPRHFELMLRHREGRPFWTDISLRKVLIHENERIMAVVRDIHERKRAEDSLQRLNRTQQTLLRCNEALIRAENEPDLLDRICRIMAEDGRFHRVRAELIEEDGAGGFRRTVQAGNVDGPGGLPEIPWHEIMGDGGRSGGAPCLVRGGRRSPDCGQAPADTPAEAVILSVPLITGSMVIGVLTVEAADAGGSDGEEAGLVVRLAGDLAFGIRSLRDREERRRMEDSLAQSRNSLAEAQALAHLGSWEYDLERDEENRSDEFFRILGLPPRGNGRANDSVFQYIHPGDLERVRNSLADTLERGKPYDIEYRIIRPDGTERTVHAQGKTLSDAKGRITRFIGTIQDITEAKRLERKYLQAQKMEAVGQLAGGIAHDFNNILTAVIGYQHLLLERLEDGKSRNLALQVMNLAEKATNLTGDLLAFSRKQPVNPKPIDLNETVGAIGEILRRLMGEEIEFRFTPLTGTLTVMAVASQIEQILMNLAMNARDAMPDGGILAIATGIEPPDRQHSWIEGPDKADAYAMISVADNGTGMDEKTQKRIFEPFFTTKGEGKGTGLGLSTVYGIVRQHGGEITVHSTPGKGTTFRVYLPLIVAEIPDTIARGERIPTTGCETVLVAEDDHELRKLMCSLLEKEGYRVLAAPDGEQALDLYSAHGSGIDIVILDVIMPKRSGREVYDIIGRAGRDVKTIFISGYSVDIIESKGIPDCCQVLGKPFSPLAFLVAVREALNAT